MGFCSNEKKLLGVVCAVDTVTIIIQAENEEMLSKTQVNSLISIKSAYTGQNYIGLVSKIIRKHASLAHHEEMSEHEEDAPSDNTLRVVLIGTYHDKWGTQRHVFKRSVKSIPSINSECYMIDGSELKTFMRSISSSAKADGREALSLGSYAIDDDAAAYLDANRFFQRHAVIVGSTGSGKSWCVARLLEQVAQLPSANAILFDIHGEYSSLTEPEFIHYKIAGPSDEISSDHLFLPHWLLRYEELLNMLDSSAGNAANQAALLAKSILTLKTQILDEQTNAQAYSPPALQSHQITLDSPLPYRFNDLIRLIEDEDQKPGGANKGKMTRLVLRLHAKSNDKRLHFMLNPHEDLCSSDYLLTLCNQLLSPAQGGQRGVKVINFSEVPSDILPTIAALIARLVFDIQQWTEEESRHPIALFCDEAHLYIPAQAKHASEANSLASFERIAKEGRKYGVSLITISQRPSELNKTTLSQSNNFIAMRLSNADDQRVIKSTLPDSLGSYIDMLPALDVGEAIIVGDASLLPSRVTIAPPSCKPRSATVNFWDRWASSTSQRDMNRAINAMLRQAKG